MSKPVIKVENLSKRYRIGERESYNTFREAIVKVTKAPFRTLLKSKEPNNTRNPQSNTIWALKDVSLKVKQGEVVGVIGRNGAGKSTLLKILSKITEPTSGRVELKGRVGSLLEVGTGFHPELTGHENIYLYGAILGMDRWEVTRKFDEIVAFAELDKFIDTPVKRYSSGMYMRLAFAVAAHLEPEILLVDEVLAVGDVAFQKKCLGKMGNVSKEGRTVLFVSHNINAVQRLCDNVVWLDEGRIQDIGQANTVSGKYMRTAFETTSERKWDNPLTAPGNDEVRIHRIYVHAPSNNTEKAISIDQQFEIGIDFWSLKTIQDLAITLHIITIEGIVAFATSSAHNALFKEKQLNCSLYNAICQIPANLLNSNRYIIRLLIVKNQSTIIYKMEDALAFDVIEAKKRNWAYTGKRPGIFAPLLSWNLKKSEKFNFTEIFNFKDVQE